MMMMMMMMLMMLMLLMPKSNTHMIVITTNTHSTFIVFFYSPGPWIREGSNPSPQVTDIALEQIMGENKDTLLPQQGLLQLAQTGSRDPEAKHIST